MRISFSHVRGLQNDRATAVSTFAVAALWLLIISYVVYAYLPVNPLKVPMPFPLKNAIHQAVPEGWAFFTKSPRDEEFQIFKKTNTRWSSVFVAPLAEPFNLFGFSRFGRVQGAEIGRALQVVPKDAFFQCIHGPSSCSQFKSKLISLPMVKNADLCGELIVTLQHPLPFAWAAPFPKAVMPTRAMRIKIPCK